MKYIKKVAETPLNEEANVVDSLESGDDPIRNAPSIHAVKEAIKAAWQIIYPVGSIYITTDTVDPAVRFGGTWEQLKQKFLIAADDESENYKNQATGGAFSRNYTPSGTVGGHALTVNEIPSHNHGVSIYGYSTASGYIEESGTGVLSDYVNDPVAGNTDNRGGGAAHNHGFTGTQSTIDTTPPYLAVYMWKRIA